MYDGFRFFTHLHFSITAINQNTVAASALVVAVDIH